MASTIDRLGTDELVNIFEYLSPEDIMRTRLNKKMRDAAKKTFVPMTDFVVDSVRKYNAMVAMSTALPHLQQIGMSYLREGRHKYSDGEDPEEDRAAYSANWITHDIEILSRFRKLRSLDIVGAPLNGRYPALFSFPLLEKFAIYCCGGLKWDLEMLEGLPSLKEIDCCDSPHLTGNINSLRVLRDTLAKVEIIDCMKVEGNFMDLADFPRLNELILHETSVTGDVRDIGERDFLALESLTLPHGVYGGRGHEFQHISDVPGVINILYSLKKQRPRLLLKDWYGKLSGDSPDRYGMDHVLDKAPPFEVWLVQAGSRAGYRWQVTLDDPYEEDPCEVNWLDPEPGRESSEYEKYIRELRVIEERVYLYKGFHEPPSEEEFNRLLLPLYGD
eukprot:scaffold10514_cov69-Skeletonema_dohrnii-CCMP3373.AAC.1